MLTYVKGSPVDYRELDKVIVETLNLHAPMKTKIVRGNDKQHVNKDLRKEIMLRTNLKKKQRNLIVKMKKKAKRD